jgi:hypothetical protein
VSKRNGQEAPTFTWNLTQERIDALAQLLYKLETASDILAAGNPSAELTARFLCDLRAQCCAAGAEDPFPEMPLFPCFEGKEVAENNPAEVEE